MNRLTIWLFVMNCFFCSAQVTVSLQSYPVQYGKILKLVCSSREYHRDWHWFKGKALLYRNNRPSRDIDVDKYREEIIDDSHRQLTIYNFEFDDISRYVCSNGFIQDFIDLSKESGKFIYCDNSTKTEVKQQKQVIGIGISTGVSNVSPTPVCQLEVENNTFPVTIFKTTGKDRIVIFKTTIFNLTFFCKKPGNPFMFACNISGIVLRKEVTKICPDFEKRNDEKSSSEYSQIVMIISGIGALIICITVLTCIIRRKTASLQTDKDEAKGNVVDPLVVVPEI